MYTLRYICDKIESGLVMSPAEIADMKDDQ